MTSGRPDRRLAGLLLSASGLVGAAGTQDLDSLLRSLARAPPQKIAFVETHRSPLLERELVVSGVLEYLAEGHLSRVVTEPYRERTDVDGSDVRIQREGRPERRFSLRRSDELGGLLAAFSAVLAGDRAALESRFEVSVAFLPEGWRLDLVPKRPESRERVAGIRVQGAADAPACIAVLAPDGRAATLIRLGAAAESRCEE
jgi:hypothetical protein